MTALQCGAFFPGGGATCVLAVCRISGLGGMHLTQKCWGGIRLSPRPQSFGAAAEWTIPITSSVEGQSPAWLYSHDRQNSCMFTVLDVE